VSEQRLPPAVDPPFGGSVGEYWRARAKQHTQDNYAGVPLSKFPEDLRVYEHLLWIGAPQVVIELGSQFGGSALWFRDRLAALARYGRGGEPHVIAVDVEIERTRECLAEHHADALDGIDLVAGDVLDPGLPAQVEELLRPGERALVVEDSAHVYETTMAALDGFSRFVPVGGFFVVEDGCVDVEEMRIETSWPRGVLPAVEEWLAGPEGGGFEQRRDLELYGLSCHPGGFLQRRF
jgi:cephalosporin hydroxylase